MTNADRIRAMSDWELDRFLTKVFTDGAKYGVYGTPPTATPHPREYPRWLREEASE